MIDGARLNEQIKPMQRRIEAAEVLSRINALADAGGIMGVAFLYTDSTFYGLTRLAAKPTSVHITRIIPQGSIQRIDTGRIGYEQLTAAKSNGTVEQLLAEAFR